ncbi:hypothetical protein [Pseudomonas floridensis]|uniref:hypothetical protein n=1 Tax=Pseudomonas floridensis TaxID=1958950 RepID=UPI001FC9CE2F|nr:hypothetical protein [Pseudomonas floridensis]
MACHSFSSRSGYRFAALLITGLACSQAQALEFNAGSAFSQDNLAATHYETNSAYSVRNTNVTLGDLQALLNDSRQNAAKLESLKQTVEAQARLIEELKRSNGNSSRSSESDLSGLKSRIDEQGRGLAALQSQVGDLKRSSGSNASSNDLSSLKNDISNTRSDLNALKSTVSTLSTLSNRVK